MKRGINSRNLRHAEKEAYNSESDLTTEGDQFERSQRSARRVDDDVRTRTRLVFAREHVVVVAVAVVVRIGNLEKQAYEMIEEMMDSHSRSTNRKKMR